MVAVRHLAERLVLAQCTATNTKCSVSEYTWAGGSENEGASDFVIKDINKKRGIDVSPPCPEHRWIQPSRNTIVFNGENQKQPIVTSQHIFF
jgi:hypothetical protein